MDKQSNFSKNQQSISTYLQLFTFIYVTIYPFNTNAL